MGCTFVPHFWFKSGRRPRTGPGLVVVVVVVIVERERERERERKMTRPMAKVPKPKVCRQLER